VGGLGVEVADVLELLDHLGVGQVERQVLDLDRDLQLLAVQRLAEPDQVVDLADQLGGVEAALVDVLVGVDLELAVPGEARRRHRRGRQDHRQVGRHALLGLVAQRVPDLVGLVDRDDDHQRLELGHLGEDVGVGRAGHHDLDAVRAELVDEQAVEYAVVVDEQDASAQGSLDPHDIPGGPLESSYRPPRSSMRVLAARSTRSRRLSSGAANA
jgi:hypothetical protein